MKKIFISIIVVLAIAGFLFQQGYGKESETLDNHSIDNALQRTNAGSISPDRTVYPVPWEDRSPLKQFKDGIDPHKIQCRKNLHLVIKAVNGSPACVKPDTKRIMIERGWATKYDEISETKSWNTASDWNSLNLLRNNDGLYCSSTNNKSSDQCYYLEEIVFGDHHKKGEQGWKLYPGGAGWRLPENSTLTPIYKEVKFGMMPLDFTTMLDDTTFVNKCESDGGTWNYTNHYCEGLLQICESMRGVYVMDASLVRTGCVFPYEN